MMIIKNYIISYYACLYGERYGSTLMHTFIPSCPGSASLKREIKSSYSRFLGYALIIFIQKQYDRQKRYFYPFYESHILLNNKIMFSDF